MRKLGRAFPEPTRRQRVEWRVHELRETVNASQWSAPVLFLLILLVEGALVYLLCPRG